MLRKAYLSIILLTVALAFVFAGGSAESKSKENQTVASSAGNEPVTITMSWWGNEARHKAIKDALDAFEKKYDWIKVIPTFSGWDGYHDKLTVQLSTGNAPDVFAFSASKVLDYGLSGSLLDLNSVNKDLPALNSLKDVLKSNTTSYYAKDALVGLPAGISVLTIMYNKKIFDQAKVPYPTESDSWISFGQKLQAVHKALPSVYGDAGWFYNTLTYMLMLKQLGVEPLDVSVSPPKINLDPTANKKIWTWVESLWADGTIARDQGDQVDFKSGNVAAKVGVSSIYGGTQAQTTDPLGIVLAPMTFSGTGKKIALAPSPGFDWGIPTKTKHKKEAAMLLNFLLTDPSAVSALGLSLGVPPAPAATDYLTGNVYKKGTTEFELLQLPGSAIKNAEELWSLPSAQGYDEADDAFQTLLEGYVFKKTNMDQFVDLAQKKMNEILKDSAK